MMALLSELRPALALPQLRAGILSHAAGQSLPAGVDLCATVMQLTGKCTCLCSSTALAKTSRDP
jgi:hypothetical protein